MNKIVKYGVVSSGANDFYEKMEEAIAEGWQPIGGVTFYPETRSPMQAIVMYDDDIPKDGERRIHPQTGEKQIYSRKELQWLNEF